MSEEEDENWVRPETAPAADLKHADQPLIVASALTTGLRHGQDGRAIIVPGPAFGTIIAEAAQRLGPKLTDAILVIDNATGEVRAHVGAMGVVESAPERPSDRRAGS